MLIEITRPGQPLEREVLELHELHGAALLRYACSLAADAESARDAVQEVFLRYLIERSYSRAIVNPRPWLYQVLRNYLRDRRKAASAQTQVTVDDIEGRPDPSHDPETLVARSQTVGRIAAALSNRELECLELRAVGMSYQEIGAAMDVRIGTVGVLLSRALDKIRRLRTQGVLAVGLAAVAVHLAPK